MDKAADVEALREGLRALDLRLEDAPLEVLLRFRDELLKWNRKVNLTAITDPREVLEKHFFDSLAVMPEVPAAGSVLDLGAGAGFPGIPWKIARRELDVTLVDTVGKKVAFMKNALASLRLVPGARALHARAEGDPEKEGLPLVELAVSRAFKDVAEWVPLAAKYLRPEGRVLAMLGQLPSEAEFDRATGESGLRRLSVRQYRLPWSGAERAVAVFGR